MLGLQVPTTSAFTRCWGQGTKAFAPTQQTLPTEPHLQMLSFPLGTGVQAKAHSAALSPPRVTLLANSHGQRKPGRFLKISSSDEEFKVSCGYYLAHRERTEVPRLQTPGLSAQTLLVHGAPRTGLCWSPWERLLLYVFC